MLLTDPAICLYIKPFKLYQTLFYPPKKLLNARLKQIIRSGDNNLQIYGVNMNLFLVMLIRQQMSVHKFRQVVFSRQQHHYFTYILAVRFYGGGKWSPRENQCWNISLTNFNTYPYLNGGIHTTIVSEKTIHPAKSQLDKLDGINTAIDGQGRCKTGYHPIAGLSNILFVFLVAIL